jgi:hypothetical protein
MALKLISAGLWAMTVLGNPITAELPKPDFKGPMTTLKPAVHWDHDKYDLSHLIPSQTSSLYWSSSGVSRKSLRWL